MPSFIGTPAQLRITPGDLTFLPARMSIEPASLKITGSGSVQLGPGTNFAGGDDVLVPDLDNLQRQISYFNEKGFPTAQMQSHWQKTIEAIIRASQNVANQLTDLQTIVNRIANAEALAAAANETASRTEAQIALGTSWVEGPPPSASSAGMITIPAHRRYYAVDQFVNVNGGALSGYSPGDNVAIFYDDELRQGGAVVYQGTTGIVAQEGARHIVGRVIIPPAGEVDNTGPTTPPPGYIDPGLADYYRSLNSI